MSVGTKSPFCSLERLAKHAFLPTSCGVCTYWMKLVGDYWPHGQHGLATLLRQAQQVSSIHPRHVSELRSSFTHKVSKDRPGPPDDVREGTNGAAHLPDRARTFS